ncbi:type II CRISPR RNA-guided endonuclease Cas9 [Campylobacter sp. JMF_01 NE2]|uniref:type II CRISPR RNA-guided endonuclease Cas9 n=1 Tax=unclassified Campylobacter TaxID=2593542 RepID=UPI0022E9BACF|nr:MULTISPECIES: type II CRISPR RNA-guided endonuclease Cas9 [unclassified Campylobacter]MDA3052706.1 type II CRISPR RNA-guided endonuclease Cas9 [Campylobacter sp. JMF_03 NE3]MDA3067037.1 type II CRISPR RNA-guided endonuclease Cas9 [Campylobacter sp. JMF_01 NE2]
MRKIGFDIGISSIGWALVDTGESDNEFEIIDCGVRIFEKAENPKDGSSLALPRREARSARRRLARRKARLNAVKRLLCKEFDIKFNDFIMQGENLPKIFATDKNTLNPWQLRKFALERKLDKFELARVILHIAKHRGYDDLRYFGDSDDADSKKVLGAISKNKKFTERGFKTASNMLLNDFEKKGNFKYS